MKFWPLSAVAEMVPPALAQELRNFCYRMPSRDAYAAAISAIRHAQPVHAPNLVTVDSIGTPTRRMYTGYPETAEWLHLERGTVIEENGWTFILIDALH